MRQFGYNVIYLVQLIRFFGASEGLKIFLKIIFSGKKSVIEFSSKKFNNSVKIRKGTSDLPIFYQVFADLQYDIYFHLDFRPVNIIDAGSNVGYSCLYFARIFPDARIVGLEPQRQNFEQLRFNTRKYSNITPLNVGVWYKPSSMTIKDESEWSASFEVEESSVGSEAQLLGMTIEEIAKSQEFDRIDIVKMDIEGAEYGLFANNPHGWLEKTRCLIIELHDNLQPGTSRAFFREMSRYDWRTFIKGENIICFKA